MDKTANPFTEDYYLRGPQSGLSNYEDYRWMPEQTKPMVDRMGEYLGISSFETLLDFGCARGYVVRAFREIGVRAWGCDISEWAIAHADEEAKPYLSSLPKHEMYDWIVAKDCLEHIEPSELFFLAEFFLRYANKGGLVIVPLAGPEGRYICPRDEGDSTHVIRWTLDEWLRFFDETVRRTGEPFTVNAAYHVPGIKKAAEPWPFSCGFITFKRHL